jgi:UDP-3-O-[3-hydroxymyristoyl] glucosamine N-acyltransferase
MVGKMGMGVGVGGVMNRTWSVGTGVSVGGSVGLAPIKVGVNVKVGGMAGVKVEVGRGSGVSVGGRGAGMPGRDEIEHASRNMARLERVRNFLMGTSLQF